MMKRSSQNRYQFRPRGIWSHPSPVKEGTLSRDAPLDFSFVKGDEADRVLSALRGPLFFKVLDKVSQGIVVTNQDREIILANRSFLETTGSSFSQISGKRCSFMQGAETCAEVVRQISECLNRLEEFNGEILNYRLDSGEPFWNELTIAPIVDQGDRHIGFLGITRDITDRKEAFAELSRRKRMYSVIFENVQAGLVLHGPNGVIEQINPKARELLAVSDEVVGADHRDETLWDFVRTDGSKMPIDEYPLSVAMAKGGVLTDYVVGVRKRDTDATKWVICNACPEFEDDQLNCILVSFTEITGLIEKDTQLQLSEERFRIVSKIASDAIWDADLVSKKIWRSDGWTSMTGTVPSENLILRSFPETVEEDRDRVRSSFSEALQSDASTWEELYRLKGASGAELFVHDKAILIRDDKGSAIRAIGAISDLTKERAQDEALRRSERMSALGSFTGGVAHDFNNLLMIIAGNAELLEDEILTDDAMEMVENIKQASKNGADLTGRLLSFARQQALASDTVYLEALFETLGEMLRSMVPESIELKFNAAEGVWPVWCDRSQIENAIINLVLNSRDALEQSGTITVAAKNLEDESVSELPEGLMSQNYVAISVSDDGPGISADVMPSILEPFFTTKEVGSGTGLGLSMVYGFAKQSGGDLEIDSSEGRGTSVSLYLPRSFEPKAKRAKKRSSDLPKGSETILVVEDDIRVLAYVEKLLSSLGYQVHSANDGVAAIELIKGGLKASVLLTDIIMPNGVSGLQLAQIASDLVPDIKIIFMSGYLGTDALESFQKDPTIPVLRKPYKRVDLANTIRELLD